MFWFLTSDFTPDRGGQTVHVVSLVAGKLVYLIKTAYTQFSWRIYLIVDFRNSERQKITGCIELKI